MKQTALKLIALLLVLMMAFSLVACRAQVRAGDMAPDSSDEDTDAPEDPTDPEDTADPDEPTDPENDDPDPDDNQASSDDEAELIGQWTADICAGAFLNRIRDKIDLELLKYLDFDEITVTVTLTLRSDFTYTLEVDEEAYEAARQDILRTIRQAIPRILIDVSKYTDEDLLEILKEKGLDVDEMLNARISGSFRYEDGRIYYSFDDPNVDLSRFADIELKAGEFLVISVTDNNEIVFESKYLPIHFFRR